MFRLCMDRCASLRTAPEWKRPSALFKACPELDGVEVVVPSFNQIYARKLGLGNSQARPEKWQIFHKASRPGVGANANWSLGVPLSCRSERLLAVLLWSPLKAVQARQILRQRLILQSPMFGSLGRGPTWPTARRRLVESPSNSEPRAAR